MAVGHKQHEAVDRLVLEPVEVAGRVPVTEVARPAAQVAVEILHDLLDGSSNRSCAVSSRTRSRACCIAVREGQRARKVTCRTRGPRARTQRSEEHTSELQS